MMEGNLLTVCGQQCIIEFQPSADQSGDQSPNANVHKGELG